MEQQSRDITVGDAHWLMTIIWQWDVTFNNAHIAYLSCTTTKLRTVPAVLKFL
jgi:hypothetical protein